jgi:hypothetical protein
VTPGDVEVGAVEVGAVEVGAGSGASVGSEVAVLLGLDVGCGVWPVMVGLGAGEPVVAVAGAMPPTASMPTRAAEAQMRLMDVLVNESPKNHELKVITLASRWGRALAHQNQLSISIPKATPPALPPAAH